MYVNAYDFFLERFVSKLKNINIGLHLSQFHNKNIKIIIIDFCGKIKKFHKNFLNIKIDIYVAFNCFEDEIYTLIDDYDLVYFFIDEKYIDNFLMFYKKSNLFIIFNGPTFKSIKNFYYL